MAKRKSRDSELMEEVDFSKPLLDIYKLGGDEDPCFGKLHDLTASECIRCGDSELCQVATQQRQVIDREEDKTPYMDQVHDNQDKVIKSIKRLQNLGKRDKIIIAKVTKRFNLTAKEVKQIIKNIG